MKIELRDYQNNAIDNMLNIKNGERKLVNAPTGCHSKGTLILMYNGEFKKVEDIVIGDLVMGVDSQPRMVMDLHRGKDEMFEVIPNRGKSFIVNKGHILSLKETSTKSVVNISVGEYLDKTNYFKHLHKLYRSEGIEFKQNNNLPIDPYLLGLLIGDGSFINNNIMITTADKEIVNYIYNVKDKYCCDIRHESMENNKASNYHFINKKENRYSRSKNLLKNALYDLELYGHRSGTKFIPNIYKTCSKKDRMLLLAGLFDTDGSVSRSGIEYTSKSFQLCYDISFIARSLGYYVSTIKTKIVNNVNYYRIHINGSISELPLKVHVPADRKMNKGNVSGFRIERRGVSDYYGIEIDRDHLYMLEDFTITHNSGKTIILSEYCRLEKDKRILIVVDAEELVSQTKDKMINFVPVEEIGLIQSDKYNQTDKRITVAMRQSILHPKSSRIETILFHGEIDIMVVDECHIAVEAQNKLIEKINPKKVIGLSATPYATGLDKVYKDGEAYHIHIMDLIKQHHLCQPRAYTAYTDVDLSNIKTLCGDFNQGELDKAINIDERNKLIVDKWKEVASDRKHTICFCGSIQHAEDLANEFNRQGISAANLDSTFDNSTRKETIAKYESGEIKVICQIGIMVKGYDFQPTDCIMMCKSTSSLMYYQQSIGRGLRTAEGKEDCLIIDIVDNCQKKNMTLLNMHLVMGLKDGENVDDMEQRIEQEIEEEKLEREREEQKAIERQKAIEKLMLKEIDLFNSNIFNVRENSVLDWYFNKIGNCDIAMLTVSKNIDFYVASGSTYTSYKRTQGNGYEYELEAISQSNSLKELMEEVESIAKSVEGSAAYTNPKSRWKIDTDITLKQKQACKNKDVKTKWDVMKYFSKRNCYFALKDIL